MTSSGRDKREGRRRAVMGRDRPAEPVLTQQVDLAGRAARSMCTMALLVLGVVALLLGLVLRRLSA